MTDTDPKQVVIVNGDLQISPPTDYKETRGLISFMGPLGTQLGQIRSYGYAGFGNLLLDSSDLNGGLEFRTSNSQGSNYYLGGQEGQMPLAISGDTSTLKYVNIEEKNTQVNQGLHSSTTLLTVKKVNTTSASTLSNNIASYMLESFKAGESTNIALGNNTYSGWSNWGYTSPSGSGSDINNKSYIGMGRNGTEVKNIEFKTDGSVNIPTTITANTVSATTYVGLPAFNPAVLDPITLDSVNDRVGINNTFPSATLDVVGDVYIKGNVDVRTIIGDTIYQELKIDKTTHRVGIQTSSPTEVLDVEGNIKASGSVSGATLGGTLSTAAQTNITSVGTLSSLTVTGDVILNSTLIKSNTGTPEGTQTAPVGSLFLRKDGTSGTTLYTKESGTGNTGWNSIGNNLKSYVWTRLSNTSRWSNPITTSSSTKIFTFNFTLEPNATYLIRFQIGIYRFASITTSTLSQMYMTSVANTDTYGQLDPDTTGRGVVYSTNSNFIYHLDPLNVKYYSSGGCLQPQTLSTGNTHYTYTYYFYASQALPNAAYRIDVGDFWIEYVRIG